MEATAGISTISDSIGYWAAAKARPCEFQMLRRKLTYYNVPHFVPTEKIRNKINRSTYDRQLWPGYLFFELGEFEWAGRGRDSIDVIHQTKNVASVVEDRIPARLKRELLKCEEMMNLDRAYDDYGGIVVGRTCRVTAGALINQQGRVDEIRKGFATLTITILGEPRPMVVSMQALELI